MLYKLVSHLLFKRLQTTLDDRKSVDQAGFRTGYSTTDHLFMSQQLRQRAAEWHQPLFVASIDFFEVFDTVQHSSAWRAHTALRQTAGDSAY